MICPSLRKVMIEHLVDKRIRMRENGANCADIDRKLLELLPNNNDKSQVICSTGVFISYRTHE